LNISQAFIPKLSSYYKFRQVFWLIPVVNAFPLRLIFEEVACSLTTQTAIADGTYSCGYSSGFSPDSLFIRFV